MKLLNIVESIILLENRKDDAFKKYFEKYKNIFDGHEMSGDEDLKNSIQDLSDRDPSGNNKYIDWMVETLISKLSSSEELRANYLDGDNILLDTIIDYVTLFHNNSQRLTQVWTANKGFPKKIVDNPREIKNWGFGDLKVLDHIIKEEEKEKIKKEDVNVLFEDDKYLIISPKTYESSCKYGSGTKWCVASDKTSSHFKSYTNTGKLIYVIDKTQARDLDAPLYKIALYYKDNKFQIWNATDQHISVPLEHMFSPKLIKTFNDFVTGKSKEDNVHNLKKEISNYFISHPNDNFNGWSADDVTYDFMFFRNNKNNFHVTIVPFPNRSEKIEFVLASENGTFADRYVTDLPFDIKERGGAVPTVYGIIDRYFSDYRINIAMFKATVLERMREASLNGWTFEFVDENDESHHRFIGGNDNLSSYEYDMYDISLNVNYAKQKTDLWTRLFDDTGKPIYRKNIPLNIPMNYEDPDDYINKLLESLTIEITNFMTKARNLPKK